jgi:hypothetical protein
MEQPATPLMKMVAHGKLIEGRTVRAPSNKQANGGSFFFDPPFALPHINPPQKPLRIEDDQGTLRPEHQNATLHPDLKQG